MKRVILHIDMDAFYASVEQLDNPTLSGKPVIVGGVSNRGVVSTANYEARKFGVRSAMPIFQARQKCPHGVFLPVRMTRYKEISQKIMMVLEGFTPLIEQVSIDEAYMDISGTEKILGSAEELGLKIKDRIKSIIFLSCSIGIAPNKFLAKIASDLNKPDGLTIISPEYAPSLIKNLPVEKVPGVGKKNMETLHGIGLMKLGDIKRVSRRLLIKKTGSFGKRLMELSMGIDESPVTPFTESKSISSEDTLSVDTNDRDILKKHLLIQSENVGRRLREKGLKGTTVTLKLKRADFKQVTRSATLDKAIQSSNLIYKQGLRLLEEFNTSIKFRLIGIGISNLFHEKKLQKQLNLFDKLQSADKSWEDIERAMDTIKKRFGRDAINRGGLFP